MLLRLKTSYGRFQKVFLFDQACNLLGSYETTYHCLTTYCQLQSGETVLIHGASGATGLAARSYC